MPMASRSVPVRDRLTVQVGRRATVGPSQDPRLIVAAPRVTLPRAGVWLHLDPSTRLYRGRGRYDYLRRTGRQGATGPEATPIDPVMPSASPGPRSVSREMEMTMVSPSRIAPGPRSTL